MIESTVSIKLESFEVPSLASEVKPQRAVALPVPAAEICVSSSNDWTVPNLSPRQFRLSEIPSETLLKMCDDFKAEVFKRAGHPLPSNNVDNRLEMFKRNICKGFSLLPRDITIEQPVDANDLTIYIDCAYDLYEGLKKRCQDVIPSVFTWKLIIQRSD